MAYTIFVPDFTPYAFFSQLLLTHFVLHQEHTRFISVWIPPPTFKGALK